MDFAAIERLTVLFYLIIDHLGATFVDFLLPYKKEEKNNLPSCIDQNFNFNFEPKAK